MYRLFPRNIGAGTIEPDLLKSLLHQAGKLFGSKDAIDMSRQLAGELAEQIALPLTLPVAKALKAEFEQACELWIQESSRDWDGAAHRFWPAGSYKADVYEIWLNRQVAGDFNPVHVHGGAFSGVLYLKVPEQIDGERKGGAICFHGPECFDPSRFQMGMLQYFQPKVGEYFVFPAWQPHSVNPFQGEGERWSLAFNAVVQRSDHSHPSSS